MSLPCALILDHSFVRRLSYFLSHSKIYSHNLGLQEVAEITFLGVSRRTLTKVEKFDLGFVRAWKPDIVILELGTNNLTKFSPEAVGSSLEELVQLLYENCSVKVIGVCQVIKHCPQPPKMLNFNSRVIKLHKYLKVVLEPLQFCFYWRHIGFCNRSSGIYLEDGVHLNNLGLIKLYRSYRGAVLKALSILNGA